MGFERRWHVVLSARSCRIPVTLAASLLHWRIKLSCRISPLLKSRNLFICAKDLRVEADPAMWRSIAPSGNILLSKIATGLTQPSKATVIFWIADPRVTASARIVLVMSQGPLWSWQVPMASRVYGERHGGGRRGLCRLHEAGRVIGNRLCRDACSDGLFGILSNCSGSCSIGTADGQNSLLTGRVRRLQWYR